MRMHVPIAVPDSAQNRRLLIAMSCLMTPGADESNKKNFEKLIEDARDATNIFPVQQRM